MDNNEILENTPALPTTEKATAAEATSAWVCPDFKVSGVFSSHMVLQREKPIRVWGFSDTPGSRVAGSFMGETVTATVGEDNRWTLTFSSHLVECEPQIMVISDDRDHTVTFEDILVGKVGDPEVARELLGLVDTLVDGRFEADKKDLSLMFRGSSNQRILDVKRSVAEGKAVIMDGTWERRMGSGNIYDSI